MYIDDHYPSDHPPGFLDDRRQLVRVRERAYADRDARATAAAG